MKSFIPKIDTEHICIANKEETVLSAVVSSYFSKKGVYLPMFIFPDVNVPDFEGDDWDKDGFIARALGTETAVLINNAMARMEKCKGVILVCLKEHQKTYFQKYLKNIPVIEINNLEEAEKKLLPISKNKKTLECKSTDILNALFIAKKENKRLIINEAAPLIAVKPEEKKGIVILENNQESFEVIAVNYAHSVDANLVVVGGIEKEEEHSIERNIQKWRENKSFAQLKKVLNKIEQRVGKISFSKFEYATFFTTGLPYSLAIKNVIPCSYVHLHLRVDLFVSNSITFENINRFNSAVVFSPGFFDDEETKDVFDFFKNNKYYVRPLVGYNATVANLDFYAQHFPYDIFHICSHGGEVDGCAVVEKFKDRNGIEHTVEYDEVVGFAPVSGKDLIQVHRKTIFRKFDGFTWMGEDLRSKKYPNFIFEDMRKVIYQSEEKNKNIRRARKEKIPNSCAIVCTDSIHQGMFRTLASHSSPFIFNNTCWSWSEVSHFFLGCGARGYVGTLWEIGNPEAVKGANVFYKNLFGKTILEAFFEAVKSIRGTPSEDIYGYWGLHFTTLSPATDSESSRSRVFGELMRALFSWVKKVKTTKNSEVKKNSIEIVKLIDAEIIKNFKEEDYDKWEAKMQSRFGDIIKQARSVGTKKELEALLLQESRFIDHPPELRKIKK